MNTENFRQEILDHLVMIIQSLLVPHPEYGLRRETVMRMINWTTTTLELVVTVPQ
jgi:hypothetical protein